MICVILGGALGDFILALPALMRIRSVFPGSRIHLVGNPAWLPIAEETLPVDRTFSLETLSIHQGFMQPLSEHHRLHRFLSAYDLIISWFGDREGCWKKNICQTFPGRAHVFPFHRHDRFPGHVSDFYLDVLGSAGIAHGGDDAPLPWPASRAWPCFRGSDRWLCIHPGSGAQEKNWPADRFLCVAEAVQSLWKIPIRILLGPAEEVRKPFWKSASGTRFTVQTDGSLEEVSRTLAESRLYLGNDSGITHLAASLGVPTLALFGPTDPRRWGPRGPRVRILCNSTPRSPGKKEGRPDMKPDEVVYGLEELRGDTAEGP